MPVLMTFLYGYAINMDIEDIKLAVIDNDRTKASLDLIQAFYGSTYFSGPNHPVNPAAPEEVLRTTAANAVLVIQPGFEKAVREGRRFELGMYIDGADNNVAAAVQNYTQGVLRQEVQRRLPPGVQPGGIRISQQILYNPDLKSAKFFVPGLIAIILVMISALLTSITIAREKETGTMEQLLTAPVTPVQIIAGKIFPYIFIALLDGGLILILARLLFGVPFEGSYLLMLLFSLIYIAAALSLGILISSLVSTQQVAMMFAVVVTMLPSVMLSGFIFSIDNMPVVLRWLSHVVPARYFVPIIRGIMLKDSGLMVLAMQGLGLVGLAVVFVVVAIKRFTVRVA
jgi:ABC-2 type transport system permease protein